MPSRSSRSAAAIFTLTSSWCSSAPSSSASTGAVNPFPPTCRMAFRSCAWPRRNRIWAAVRAAGIRSGGSGQGPAGYHDRGRFPPTLRDSPMARSKSSQRWLKEHVSDPFVKRAEAEGMRSRAVYKLEELVARDRLLKPGMTVVDLGAAPGGWSQWLRQELDRLDPERPGRVIALDILEMPPLAGVEFLQGDFREDAVLSALETALGGRPVDLVLSDMAPNKSGMGAVDQPRAMYLSELAMDFADGHLKPGGGFLIKLFHGTGFDDYVRELRRRYDRVAIRKPSASRQRS